MNWKRWRHLAGSLMGLALFLLALWVLRRELRDYDRIVEQVRRFAAYPGGLAAGVVMTVLAYLVLTGYDLLAMLLIRHRLGVGKVAFTAFVSYVFSNNIGMSVVGASAVRLRIYSNWGLSVVEIVKIVAFVVFTFWLGLLAIAGLAFLIQPMALPESWQVAGMRTARPIGVALTAVIVGYVALCWRHRRPVVIFGRPLPIPTGRIAIAQVAVGSLDWALAAGVFYVLLTRLWPDAHWGTVVVAYFLAVVLGQASHSPGGLGVFEASLVSLLRPFGVGEEEVLAAALAYRGIYLLLPLLVGTVCLGGYELFGRRRGR